MAIGFADHAREFIAGIGVTRARYQHRRLAARDAGPIADTSLATILGWDNRTHIDI